MKHALIALITLATAHAAEFRTWTQQATGRTITAKITEKTKDHAKAKVVTRSGKVHWLKSSDLSQDDQEYVLNWEPPVDHLTCRVVKSGDGAKVIRATVTATKEAVRLQIGPCPRTKNYHFLYVPKDQQMTVDFICVSKYDATVSGMDSKAILDQEKWNRKTGL